MPYLRRVEKTGVGSEVGNETEEVDGRKVNRCPGSRFATEIEDWLRIEGERPAEGVDPAKEVGDNGEEVE